MEEPKITLDSSTFKALASGTRVNILKSLEKRNHTQSELASLLKMSIPTVKDHLKEMEAAGLVRRREEGRKWIYYSLTEKSKCILDPERKRLWIVLGFFVFATIGTVITLSKYLGMRAVEKANLFAVTGGEKLMAARAPEAADMAAEPIITASLPPEALSYLPYVLAFFVVITIILSVLSVYFLKKSRVLKKK